MTKKQLKLVVKQTLEQLRRETTALHTTNETVAMGKEYARFRRRQLEDKKLLEVAELRLREAIDASRTPKKKVS